MRCLNVRPHDDVNPNGYVKDHFFGFVPAISFLSVRRQHFKKLRTEEPIAQAKPIVETLKRDGVVLIPDLLPSETIAQMAKAVPELSSFIQSPEGDRAYIYQNAHLIPAMQPFYEHPLITAVCRSYLSTKAISFRRTIGLKIHAGTFPTFESNYHMDTWKSRLKVFFFLEDITASNAPMVYLRGSHHGMWRLWTEERIYRYYRTDRNGFAAGGSDFYFLGSFWPHEVRQLKNDYGYTDLQCVGKAGTALIFDGRGLHHATPLIEGRRLILTNYIVHPGEHT